MTQLTAPTSNPSLDIPKQGMPVTIITGFLGSGKTTLLNQILQNKPQDVFRAKGILWFNDSDLRHVFQLNGLRYSLHADEWHTPPKNQAVFIGRKLDIFQIHSQLNECLV